MARFLCAYCATSWPSSNGTGSDVRCCGEVGHVTPDEPTPAANDCPACAGPGVYLGTLGRLAWLSCRDCGCEFHVPAALLNELENQE